ncbi:hypothetical protein K440DRAFT_665405, partial [Wilcoxina mikolae CBS 423.85]
MTQRRTRLATALDLESTTPHTRRRSTRNSQGGTSPSAQSSSRQQAIDANPSPRKGKRKQPPDASQSAGSSKRVTTGSGILAVGTGKPGSDDPPNSNPRPKCFRISGLPLSWSENDLFNALHAIDPSLTRQDFRPSLNPSCYNSTQTALLNLDPCTEHLQRHSHLKVSESASRTAALLMIDSHFYNLTPLNVPEGEVVADVIAVTGLAGHAFGSWRNRETHQMWLKDLLPLDIQNIRIMSYGYDSGLLGHRNAENRLLDYQRRFIQDIENSRSLVKALIECKRNRTHAHILDATHSIIFFGTPHQGMRTYDLEEMVDAESGGYETSRHNLLRQLREGSEFLENQKEELSYIWEEYKPKIVSFYETVQTSTVKRSGSGRYARDGNESEMVKRFSAQLYIPTEQRVPVKENHTNMVKFASAEDGTYRTVVRYLKEWVESITQLSYESLRKGHRMVPYSQNIDFTGHEDFIALLVKLLASPKIGHHRVALTGLGGIGKTQIALEYVYRQVDPECHIFWVYGNSQGTFSRDYQDISTRLKIPRISDKEDEILLGVKHWFESDESGKWLLVLDNADNSSEFKGNRSGISRYLPQGSKGTLIVTTRSKTVASRLGCKTIDVVKMKLEESEALFRQLHHGSIETTDMNAVHELLRVLDYLPLAIAAASAYMKETGTLPEEYLDILNSTRASQASLLMKKFYDIRRDPQAGTESTDKEDMTESVLSTYHITFRRIQESCPLAANLLKLMAFLDQRAIPELFLTESGLDGAKDSLLFNEARGYLFDFSLISRDANPKTYNIHRLVHLAMETYAFQTSEKTINWKEKALDVVSRLFPPGEYKDLATCTTYIPHALVVLRHADKSETNSVKLFKNLGMYFMRTGQY